MMPTPSAHLRLWLAIAEGRRGGVVQALAGGADPDAPCDWDLAKEADDARVRFPRHFLRTMDGQTPVMACTSTARRARILPLLIDAGADVDRADNTEARQRALHMALRNGHLDAARQLVAAGASLKGLEGEAFSPMGLATNLPEGLRATECLLDAGWGEVEPESWLRFLSRCSETSHLLHTKQDLKEDWQAILGKWPEQSRVVPEGCEARLLRLMLQHPPGSMMANLISSHLPSHVSGVCISPYIYIKKSVALGPLLAWWVAQPEGQVRSLAEEWGPREQGEAWLSWFQEHAPEALSNHPPGSSTAFWMVVIERNTEGGLYWLRKGAANGQAFRQAIKTASSWGQHAPQWGGKNGLLSFMLKQAAWRQPPLSNLLPLDAWWAQCIEPLHIPAADWFSHDEEGVTPFDRLPSLNLFGNEDGKRWLEARRAALQQEILSASLPSSGSTNRLRM